MGFLYDRPKENDKLKKYATAKSVPLKEIKDASPRAITLPLLKMNSK